MNEAMIVKNAAEKEALRHAGAVAAVRGDLNRYAIPYRVGGKGFTTTRSMQHPWTILRGAGFDPKEYYLTQMVYGEELSHEDDPDKILLLHEGAEFYAIKKGDPIPDRKKYNETPSEEPKLPKGWWYKYRWAPRELPAE